ncbi:dihydrofolate reductase [Heyndrickxia sporothermodurans]|uniref:Dihydrofolate reductase n=1 Tax=Heyndrickxia sporothermodurans TaxID=46224 RepID=A0A150KSY4_9BACI|nr:dihydrofolate reductase [Heyndrickxia sporothermodurans]KYD03251.1 Dihydrofolate reductase [Heyndrickxia sporothermodurans]MBL5768467.1 dihydrofolate reductase [Heyndrickxia sporothermodurans]MBL5772121.1 dihydrofolate reductase [Heyndrickxia sporothermodurans]MBL5775686.1 dihydrofolate reductase [Heyndrickxia sporothermodurans]MBL5779233.1 dihydrofolate reductase [Heyndrickxia sporothermodurans]
MISFLWAQDEKGVIGRNNQLPWYIPEDLKYFKKTTMGHPIVMGRKTFESIGKPLPGRQNIIITRDENFCAKDCLVLQSKHQLLNWADQQDKEVFITGGAEIFGLFMDKVDRLYVTKIFANIEGDTYFPIIDWSEWELVSSEKGPKNEENPYDYEFQVYERK